MKAEILATGDEIRSGALIDSNSAYIAERLEREGLEVTRHHCVGDDLGSLTDVFREIAQRADIAVVTGGLGPTSDDRTTEAAARAAGVGQVLNADALATIEVFFKRLGRALTPSNRKQAFFPDGSEILPNPIGTAPGFKIRIEKCTFFCLPGVPVEMRKMLTNEAIPRLLSLTGDHRQISMVRTLSTFGATESMVGERLSGVIVDFPDISVGYRAKFPEIQVRLYIRGDDEAEMIRHLDVVAQRVAERLGDKIFSSDGRSMAAVVGDLLIGRNATIAVAESCTGGLISHWLTNTAGSSRYFLFSGVTYANDAKMDILGVSAATLTSHGAVSLETVREMAAGARKISHATYAIATSGVAGPDGGTDEKPVGTVCVGLAGPDGVTSRRFYFPFGNRLAKKKLFAMAALDTLRRHISEMGELDGVVINIAG
jgi:nicotinamide-nucleotide amidase